MGFCYSFFCYIFLITSNFIYILLFTYKRIRFHLCFSSYNTFLNFLKIIVNKDVTINVVTNVD